MNFGVCGFSRSLFGILVRRLIRLGQWRLDEVFFEENMCCGASSHSVHAKSGDSTESAGLRVVES